MTKNWAGVGKWSAKYFASTFKGAEFGYMDMGIEDWHAVQGLTMEAYANDVMETAKNDESPPPWSVPYAGFSMGDVWNEETGERYHDVLKGDFETPPVFQAYPPLLNSIFSKTCIFEAYVLESHCIDTGSRGDPCLTCLCWFQENNWMTCFETRCQQDMAIMFMGGKGARQSNHQDHFSSSKWQTMFYGRKRWILHPPELSQYLYYGRVDPFYPDYVQFPRYKEALDRRFDVTIEQGETIWWPAGWWHTTHALTDGIGLARNMLDEHNFESFKVSMFQFCRGDASSYPLEQGGSYCGCMKRNQPKYEAWYSKWLEETDAQKRFMKCKARNIGGTDNRARMVTGGRREADEL